MATAVLEKIEVTSKISSTGTVIGEQKPSGEVLPRQEQTPEPVVLSAPFSYPGIPASGRPSQVLFGALNDFQYRLRRPIQLDVTTEEGHVVVNWAEIEEFGTGDSLGAAIDDFSQALRSLHRYLLRTQELGPDLAHIKQVLGDYIESRPR
jgi:hypothetical protein